MKRFVSDLITHFFDAFRGKRIFWHILAIILTYGIVTSGLDWWYFLHVRSDVVRYGSFPAVVLGGILPILIPALLLLGGWISKNKHMLVSGRVLAQSVILGSFISSLYKAVTGRVQPDTINFTVDISHKFQFGFWKHGIFWGWPSSHTTIAFSMAFALISLYPKQKWIHVLAIAYAVYVGLAVSTSIHWFSEAVAGAIIGIVIGTVVGVGTRSRLKA